MNKTLRIFQKDSRHLWPEIVLSLALTVGFAATAHFAWPQFRQDVEAPQALFYWTLWLMPISWWLLIARSIHDESLVGDRQFWITRPYGWPRVLGAKLLFITAYILAPYLLAQIFLLHQAGLHPLLVMPGLVYGLVLLFFLFIMPFVALATVTANTTRMFIIFFGLFVYTALAAYFAAVLGKTAAWAPQVTHPLAGVLLAIPIITVIVTLLQYSSRRTAVANVLLAALVLILTAGAIAAAYLPGTTRDFPALSASEPPPVNISFNPDPSLQHDPASNPGLPQEHHGRYTGPPAEIPLLLTGIAPGHAVSFEGETWTLSADGVSPITAPWRRGPSSPYTGSELRFLSPNDRSPHENGSAYSLEVPSWFLDDLMGLPAAIHIRYAVNDLTADPPSTVVFDGKSLDVPENGHCVSSARDLASVSCLYALTGPGLTHVTWTMHEACGRSDSRTLSKDQWIGDNERPLRDPDLSPVILQRGFFPAAVPASNLPVEYKLCPGTPLTFTRYRVNRRRLVEVTLPALDPRLYVPLPPKGAIATPGGFTPDIE